MRRWVMKQAWLPAAPRTQRAHTQPSEYDDGFCCSGAPMWEPGRMRATSVTVGVLVADLSAASRWYETVFELDGPSIEPVEGIVEYFIGGCWLQLTEGRPDP